MADETPTVPDSQPQPETPKVPFNAKIFLSSGAVVDLPNLVKLDGNKDAEKLTRLEWEFAPGAQIQLLHLDITKVEAITIYR